MPPRTSPLRVAVLGARTRRQGVGRWLAKHVAAHGHHVVAILGTTARSAEEAADRLASADARPSAFTDLSELIEVTAPEVIVVATPPSAHEAALEAALIARCHVLVEKPVLLGPGAGELASDIGRVFGDAGLVLAVHAQWPFTLPAFKRLHPTVDLGRVQTLEVELAPGSQGLSMVVDALPHALSLAAALRPGSEAQVELLATTWQGRDAVQLALRYSAPSQPDLTLHVRLRRCEEQPRPAALVLDGHRAERTIDEPGYRLGWRAPGGRRVALPDPSHALVGWFLERVHHGAPTALDPALVPGTGHLEQLLAALGAPTS